MTIATFQEFRNARLKLYKTLALPALLYDSEIWTHNSATKIGFESQK
jgi:hypothetical protein